jgi:DNA-binding response OmpR family regulator
MKEAPARSLKQHIATIGPLIIDRQRRHVRLHNRSIHLTPTEYALLCVLASGPGRVFRREELLRLVWGRGIFVEPRTVDAHIAKLRQKLRSGGEGPAFTETVWGVGYRLRVTFS